MMNVVHTCLKVSGEKTMKYGAIQIENIMMSILVVVLIGRRRYCCGYCVFNRVDIQMVNTKHLMLIVILLFPGCSAHDMTTARR